MANSYKMQRTKLRSLYLSSQLQGDADIVLPDAAFDRQELFESGNFAQITPKKESDYAYAGKGSSFATDSQVSEIDSMFEWAGRLNQWNVGFLIAMVCGVDTFTAGVAPANNTHVLSFADNTNLASLTNILIYDTTALRRRFLDMALKTLTLTAAESGSIKFKSSWVGTGRYQDGALAAAGPALQTSPTYLRGSDAQWSLGPSGGAIASYYPRIRSFELTLDSGVENERRCGSGVYGAFVANGNPTLKFKIAIDANDTTDIRDFAIANEQLHFQCVIPIGDQTIAQPCSIKLDFPICIIPKDDLAEMETKYVGYNLEFDQQSILKPVGAPIFTATLSNTAVAYLQTYV